MDSRAQLKSLLDGMDEDELFAAEIYLLNIVKRRTPSVRTEPRLAQLDRRAEEFRRSVEQHWRDAATHSPAGRGSISGLGGGGGTGYDFRGRAEGKMSFTYSETESTVEESLRFVAGYEIVTVDRF